MKTRFSKNTGCRYPYELNYAKMPDDIEAMDETDICAYLEAEQARTGEIAKREAAPLIQAAEDAADEAAALEALTKEYFGDKLAERAAAIKSARASAASKVAK